MVLLAHWIAPILWAAFYLYWLIASQSVKQTEQTESSGSRWLHLGLQLVAYALVLLPEPASPLTWRILPDIPATVWIGLAVLVIGLGFAVWARLSLGRNWSGRVTIKADHQLIRSGPYAIVRHPIYTGVLTGMLGTAIVVGEVRGLVAVAILLIAYWRKLTIEERMLSRQFADDYPAYQREVKALVPFVL